VLPSNISPRLIIGVAVAQSVVCSVCDQPLSGARESRGGDDLSLYGADRYGWCISCRRVVLPPWGETYTRRWDEQFELRIDHAEERLYLAWTEGRCSAQLGATFSSCLLPVGPERDAWVEGWRFHANGGTSESRLAFKRSHIGTKR
jgi:hypothetical protein